VSAPSRPLLLGLLVTLAVIGGLFVALKPPGKGADSSSPLNGPISQAQKAVVQSQVAAAKAEAAAGNTSTPTATPAPPVKIIAHTAPAPVRHHAVVHHGQTPSIPQIAPWDESRKIFVALAHHDVAVVLFWTKGNADDNSVRRAVAAVAGRPRVAIFVIGMRQVGRYPALTAGQAITVSPTTLIVGPSRRFVPITGYTDTLAIEQAITQVR